MKYRLFLVFLVLCMSVTGCSLNSSSKNLQNNAGPAGSSAESSRDNTPVVLSPVSDGKKTEGNRLVTLDISHTDQGYITAAYHGNSNKINIQITGPDNVSYLYFIREKDAYTAMPLSAGDGSYFIDIYENVDGDIYSSLFSTSIDVTLENEFLPFLYANQFVDFDESSKAVEKGSELAQDCASDLDVVTAIYNYVVEHTEYDYEKAAAVSSPYYPDVDDTLTSGTGICFDYAALMCAMLRTQQIPSKLNIGYAGDVYHAWISVYIDSIGWIDNVIQFNGTDWTLMDPTFVSTGGEKYEPDPDDYLVMYQR